MKKPVMLIVMDGYGLSDSETGNAVKMAKTPNLERLMKEYPTSTLNASGLAVGLPDGQMGNSEVGHLNIGAGRIVYQSLTRINKSIKDGDFFENKAYLEAMERVNKNDSKLHIFGLLSNGGVHSHIEHIKAIIKLAQDQKVKELYVHAFLDGRDVAPDSGTYFVQDLEDYLKELDYGKIASVHGRYYAMDRDRNWERIQLSYDIITKAQGDSFDNAVEGVKASYKEGVFDEFVYPFNVVPEGIVEDHDSVIFMNFRPDRAIQIGTAISNPTQSGIRFKNRDVPTKVFFVSTMLYNESVKGPIAYGLVELDKMYGDVISEAGLNQLRIAETEKYAHVTFFFDGGIDKEIENSERVLVNSPKVATYDLQPEMSAHEVTDKVLEQLALDKHDTVILNYANCDMVGHTGVIPAAVEAVETVDECVGKVVDAVLEKDGVVLITADHGNAEKMLNEKGEPFTAHTTSLVPLIVTKKGIELRNDGVLADLAPTMLQFLGVEQPKEMTGKTLLK